MTAWVSSSFMPAAQVCTGFWFIKARNNVWGQGSCFLGNRSRMSRDEVKNVYGTRSSKDTCFGLWQLYYMDILS